MAIINRPQGLSTAGPTWLSYDMLMSDRTVWVDSVTGSDSTGTGEFRQPVATVFGAAGALSLATTDVSNVIVCLSTHRETISADYTWSKGGVTLLSLGSGTQRAQFTASGDHIITVSGLAVRVENIYFAASTGTCTSRVTVTGAGFEMRDCQVDLGASDTTDGVLVSATANVSILGTTFKATARPTGTAQVGLRVTGASTNCLIEDCVFDGDTFGFTDSCFKIDTATADRFRIRTCTLQNNAIGKVSISGVKGLASYSADATSRVEWTE